jgi:hypothetical protein
MEIFPTHCIKTQERTGKKTSLLIEQIRKHNRRGQGGRSPFPYVVQKHEKEGDLPPCRMETQQKTGGGRSLCVKPQQKTMMVEALLTVQKETRDEGF